MRASGAGVVPPVFTRWAAGRRVAAILTIVRQRFSSWVTAIGVSALWACRRAVLATSGRSMSITRSKGCRRAMPPAMAIAIPARFVRKTRERSVCASADCNVIAHPDYKIGALNQGYRFGGLTELIRTTSL